MKRTAIQMLRMLAVCGSLLAFTVACDEDDDDNLPVQDDLEFDDLELSGDNEVPQVESDGTGTFNGTYDDATNVLTYTVTWELGNPDDEVVGMHFHGPADPTESAGVQEPIEGFTTESTGSFTDSTEPLTAQQEADLKAGLWYINIHSTTYPTGELRGNLLED
ncbi:CHRD domain-containing protein [Pontibacter sp. KCTC 32443]|uniref:CHRD domain-containing protein n=1 Tax=Pontibacter TaxID=323449 RepID=UPI00164E7466|nr:MULTISPECIES: CHRD domain-containing protein [Pontibacter]MBC5776013.1 CHRD domain-containing protein [Pontibacter sp. KCTC 32443]